MSYQPGDYVILWNKCNEKLDLKWSGPLEMFRAEAAATYGGTEYVALRWYAASDAGVGVAPVDYYYELLCTRDELAMAGLVIDRSFWSKQYFVRCWKRGDDLRTDSVAPNTNPLVRHLREHILELRTPVLAQPYAGSSARQRCDVLPDTDPELTPEELVACATLASLRGPQTTHLNADGAPEAEGGGDGYAADTEDDDDSDDHDDVDSHDDDDDIDGDDYDDGHDDDDDGSGADEKNDDEEERPLKRVRLPSEEEEEQQQQH
eukprot:m51a1_g11360 hypothetical protein (262) ;mRNA; f:23376-25627